MNDEDLLRSKAREAMQGGKLPDRRPDRTWGGPGSGGLPCAICDKLVGREEIELELQFARDGAGGALDNYHVHIRCFAAWELERQGFEAARALAAGGVLLGSSDDGMISICDGSAADRRGQT